MDSNKKDNSGKAKDKEQSNQQTTCAICMNDFRDWQLQNPWFCCSVKLCNNCWTKVKYKPCVGCRKEPVQHDDISDVSSSNLPTIDELLRLAFGTTSYGTNTNNIIYYNFDNTIYYNY